jgi:hypothetical protein
MVEKAKLVTREFIDCTLKLTFALNSHFNAHIALGQEILKPLLFILKKKKYFYADQENNTSSVFS